MGRCCRLNRFRVRAEAPHYGRAGEGLRGAAQPDGTSGSTSRFQRAEGFAGEPAAFDVDALRIRGNTALLAVNHAD